MNKGVLKLWPDAVVIALLAAALWIPDIGAVTARIFMGDQFHHFDQCVLGPAWAHAAGAVLDIDVISQYGLGMPMVMAFFMKIAGGIDPDHLLTVMVWMYIFYFTLWYVFARIWLKNTGLAAGVLAFGLLTHLCHRNVYPFLLTYPSATVVRFCWDAVFFLLILAHVRVGRGIFLGLAGAMAGFAVFYLSSTGMCLVVAWAFYVLASVVLGNLSLKSAAAWGLGIPAAFAVSLGIALGHHAVGPELQHNLSEFNNYFIKGFGTTPIYESLQQGQYYVSLMGFFIPCVYIVTLTCVCGLLWLRKINSINILAAVLAVYGLAMYHYYIARSAGTNYFTVGIPYVLIAGFWASKVLNRSSAVPRQWAAWALAVGLAAALWTTPNARAYPNVLNLLGKSVLDPSITRPLPNGKPYFHHLASGNARVPSLNSLGESDEQLLTERDFTSDDKLKEFYRKEFDLSEDARLVAALVPPGEKAAVISSYDVRILSQANRKPFFYHYPFFLSRPMRMNSFAVPSIYTVGQLNKTLKQMDEAKPAFIFIEAVYAPQNARFANPGNGLLPVLMYVHSHYTPVAKGKYLMALRRSAP